jgi:hypothetical protein
MFHRLSKPLRELVRHEQWNIGIAHCPIAAFLRPGNAPRITWFPDAPRGQFRADPFAVQRGGELYIFYEHFDYATFNGRLVALVTDSSFNNWQAHDVMPQSVHASYPFLLEHEGELYCTPETQKAGEVKLYRSRRLPDDWEFVATLLRGFPAVDPTVFRHNGRWWMFCVSGEQGADDRLHIWHAPELPGPWTPHARNPVKVDRSSARPGGTPFVHAGELFRPAQDCSRTYGGRIVLMRITSLTPDHFAEEHAAAVEPQPGWPFPDGLHTLSAAGDLTLIDAKRYLFTAGGFRQKLSSMGKKLAGG